MKNAPIITVLAAMACLSLQASGQDVWDFEYGYDHVLSANANEHNSSVANAVKIHEGIFYYYQPANGNLNPGVITKKFTFANPTEEAYLFSVVHTFKWSYGEGSGSIHASKDGATWVPLASADPPLYGQYNSGAVNGLLPASVLGTNELWIRAEINTSGSSSLRNTAQYSRGMANGSDSFRIRVNLTPEPGTNENFPVMPTETEPDPEGRWGFVDVPGGGNWFDPPMATGYLYETDGASNFTLVELPTAVPDDDGLYLVTDSVNGSQVVAQGGSYSFPIPVDEFTITGIGPAVDGADSEAFPTYLEFDQSTVDFSMTPIPEPATMSLLAIGGIALIRRRRRT
jgi:hypothetical protein